MWIFGHIPKEWVLGQNLFLPLSLWAAGADQASCWCETSPLPSAVEQAALQECKRQQWQWTDKAFTAEVPQPSGLWVENSPADCLLIWKKAVMMGRQGASHLAWPIMNRGQMNGFQGQSRKHLAMVIAVHTIYSSPPEEWFPCVCGFR